MFNRKCKITFICHGATINSEEERLSDKENYPPLSDAGEEEIEKICEWLKKRGIKNDKIYIIIYTKNETTYKKNYKLYNQDGENVLSKDDIDDLVPYENFLTYTKDNILYIIDYDGKQLISNIKLVNKSYFKNL